MTGTRWLAPSGFRAALLLALLAAAANAVWILLDHTAPAWDQAHYLLVSLQYRHAFDADGLSGMLHAIDSVDTSRGPLFPILITPFVAVLGDSARSAMVLNVVLAPVLYLAAGQIAWLLFRNGVARLLTIFLVATLPLLVGLYHNVFQDFLLASLATLSLLLLLMTDRFQRPWLCAALGLTMGLGTLAKVTFPLFVLGPLMVVLLQLFLSRRDARRADQPEDEPDIRAALTNLVIAAAVFAVVALPWYLKNYAAAREYVESTTSGPLSVGAGPKHPLTFDAAASFTANLVDSDLSWILALVAITALLLNLPRVRSLFSRPMRSGPVLKLAFLLSWVLVPYLTLVSAHNQDVRLMAAAMPGVAVLVAGAVSTVRSANARRTLVVIAVVAFGYQTLNHVISVSPGSENLTVRIGSYPAVLHLGSEPIGYEQLPGPDYAAPIVDYLARAVQQGPSSDQLHSVCLLETEPAINETTLGFAAATREAPLVFYNVKAMPEDGTSLASTLSKCNFAIYAKQSLPNSNLADVRLTLVNEEFAATAMTPALLKLFAGPSRVFSTGARPEMEGEDKYASWAGKADRVRVLTRSP
jgi:4-amino-4-deoxy-L-arabinose transferase-like glycosyltransferase